MKKHPSFEEPIISISMARKLLGKEFENTTDEEVLKIIMNLDTVAKQYIKAVPKS
jgi:hypothetical protein